MMGRLFTFLMLAALSVGAWANPCATGGRPFPVGEGTGTGGTGLQADQGDGSGMGGTGHRDGSGTGGTGQQVRGDGDGSGTGGTGVVGIITGFGSICVNELEIHYDAKTPVLVNGQSSRADQLAVGQMVAVHADGKGDNLHAKHIQVRHTLVGRVEAVNKEGQLKVWGQWVSPPRLSNVQTGQRIKVSGYRADSKHVVASRIDPALAGEPDVLTGEVEWFEADAAQVSGVRISLPAGGERLKPGQEIRVSGRPDAAGFKAERVEIDGLRGFIDKLDRINVKDKIRPAGQPGKLKVGGLEFSLDAKTLVKGGSAKELRPGRLVKVEARLQNGRAVIERIEIRDEAGARNREKSDGAAILNRQGAGNHGKQDSGRSSERGDRSTDVADHADSNQRDTRERTVEVERAEKPEKIESPEKPEKVEKTEIERIEKPEKIEIEKPEKIERVEKPEKVEIEKPEKIERIEKPEKVEIEKPEKIERIEKPEKVEIEKPEKIERPERPEKDD